MRSLLLLPLLMISLYAERAEDFFVWKALCDQSLKEDGATVAVSEADFEKTIEQFLAVTEKQLNKVEHWLNRWPQQIDIFDRVVNQSFTPYVQRLHLPEGAVVAFHGDLHGNVHALNSFLFSLSQRGYVDEQNPFQIKDKNFYLIFLGDYTDRGTWGVETIYTILRLKIENPDHVFMVRGNHEDIQLNEAYGFMAELKEKFNIDRNHRLIDEINNMYNALPVALYVGVGNNEYILCCHGGWEMGYDPLFFLKAPSTIQYHAFNRLKRKTAFDQLPVNIQKDIKGCVPCQEYNENSVVTDPTSPICLGFMWHDFIPDDGTKAVAYQHGRGWRLGKPLLDALRTDLGKHDIHVRAVFRAHQHGDKKLMHMMLQDNAGIAKLWQSPHVASSLWDGMVCTFLVAPYTGYGNSFDAWGELHVADTFNNCQLIMHRNFTDVGFQ